MVAHSNLPYIRDSDVILASYPRSGNTWIMNLLYSLQILAVEGYQHDLSSIECAGDIPDSPYGHLPGLTGLKNRKKEDTPPFRVIKTHSLPNPSYKKAIYLYRDGRDAVFSYYHYFRRFHRFSASFLEFLAGADRPALAWAQHIQSWLMEEEKIPTHFVRYEDLLVRPQSELKKILDFLGQDRSAPEIEGAVRDCDFSLLKKSEQDKVGLFKHDEDLHFFRRGQTGEWKQVYSEEHIRIFKQEAGEALEVLDYEPF
jgi:hypothetical protein